MVQKKNQFVPSYLSQGLSLQKHFAPRKHFKGQKDNDKEDQDKNSILDKSSLQFIAENLKLTNFYKITR